MDDVPRTGVVIHHENPQRSHRHRIHRALGRPDAGALRVGARADLVAVDLDSVRTAGGGPTPETVVFAAGAADVTDVVIDGRPVVVDRTHVDVPDTGAALTAAIRAVLEDR